MHSAGDLFEPTVQFAESLVSSGLARDLHGAKQILRTLAGILALCHGICRAALSSGKRLVGQAAGAAQHGQPHCSGLHVSSPLWSCW